MADQPANKAVTRAGWRPPSPEDAQHWSWVIERAQQLLTDYAAQIAAARTDEANPLIASTQQLLQSQATLWAEGMKVWHRMLDPSHAPALAPALEKDRRFASPEWRDNPLFDMIRQTYLTLSEQLLKGVDALDGVTPAMREKLRFAASAFLDAMSPANFALTNPQVLAKTFETRGENLLKGLEHMLADLAKGQLTHSDPGAFEVGRNIATTPGKVVRRTPLYELIQYMPTTERVFKRPLVIFPPWINRFYILDLNPEKSFIRWAVAQGLSVFVVSWKSADASMTEVTLDDYVLRGQIDAIDAVRDLLGVASVHAIGYCVAGTTLAATLALLAARGEAKKVKTATFFTAQVDFTSAGDLNLFVDDDQLALVDSLSKDSGFLDGRYMAATFNLLRGRDLIWNYVVNNYLLGQEYPQFDLLHWNGDTTNLPAKWHRAYLKDMYRDNKLAKGGIEVDGTPIDLTRIKTPAYVQAGREDHIAPAASVWKITDHLRGPIRFVLAGSGHIAGVVNPPDAHKYQYWTNAAPAHSLEEFIAGAIETKGSWWPDWIAWLTPRSSGKILADGARIPGGEVPALEDAPGSYVRRR